MREHDSWRTQSKHKNYSGCTMVLTDGCAKDSTKSCHRMDHHTREMVTTIKSKMEMIHHPPGNMRCDMSRGNWTCKRARRAVWLVLLEKRR